MARHHNGITLKTKMTLAIMLLFGSFIAIGITGHYIITNPVNQAQSTLALTACGITLLTFTSIFIGFK